MNQFKVVLLTFAIVHGVEACAAEVSAAFDADRQTYQISGPGIERFQAAFSATVEIAGQRHLLSSSNGVVAPTCGSDLEQTPYGQARIRVATVSFPEHKITLQLRLGEIPGQPCVLLQPVMQNQGTQPVKLVSLAAVDMPPPSLVMRLPREGDKVWLEPRAAGAIREGHGKCGVNRSTDGNPITIGGRVFSRGLGTHARSEIEIPLGGAFKRFQASVGLDDEKPGGSVGFEVIVDGRKCFDSGVMKLGEAAKTVDVDVTAAKRLMLVVNDGGDGITCDHADWADACLIVDPAAKASPVATTSLVVAGPASEWLVTAYDQSTNGGPPNHFGTLAGLEQRMNIHEYGSLYRNDGVGLLFGPVGEPVAYLKNCVSTNADGSAALQIVSEMSGIQLDPGETRAGQQAVLWMENPRAALAKWSEWVAQTHHARTNKGALAGWCSWYHLTSKIKGSDVLGVVDEVKKQPARLRPQVIQIDDGYQDFDGVWDANAKFPEGMPHYAKRIAETGARPGLWMAPTLIGKNAPWLRDPENMEAVWGKKFKLESRFRPDESGWLDPTHPRAIAHITERVRHAVESGFTYLKIDFNLMGDGGWHERKLTTFQILREHFTRIRKAAGDDTYILACIIEPNRAVVGLADAHRTSHDAHRGGVRSAINDALRCYQLNSRWFAIDNDIYYLAPDAHEVGNVQGGWNLHRTWLSLMGLSGGAALTSDPWHWDVLKPQRRTVEIMQPPAKMRSEVVDLGTAKDWPRITSVIKRPWGDSMVVLLWNPTEQPQSISLDLAQAGLDPARAYAVWSFWDNKFFGTAKRTWVTPSLEGWACQHLVFTPIDGTATHAPVLIGSNLHISSGIAEIETVTTSDKGIQVTLTDAGAREGKLFFHSSKPLKLHKASGLDAGPVEPAGENIWSIGIRARQSGNMQSLTLTTP
ncbi:MAG: NPCBM/NEW2 domain-containing protein [Verrucomicrobia bacterium]|nr:NPCBM/NEW2 domain-containing protein [Verrucomicrobiota bacterium]